jgi:acyl-CoA reductase-like NAD-dependent aldehyde dehydrogenase
MPLAESPFLAANFLRREPIGVVAAMPASTGGYFMGLCKVMAALVTGNSVVLQPSPLCSASSVEIANAIMAEPEIPVGIFHLSARMATIVVGDPTDPETDFGPVVCEAARDRIESYVSRAVEAGARVVTGGTRPDIADGVEPTLIDGVINDMEIARNEIFGPVLAVLTYKDLNHAVTIANDTDYGLSATIWSED